MREVANFMHFYPAYKLQDVLDEYAITFYALLQEGYRLHSQHLIELANLALLPGASQETRNKYLRQLEWESTDPSDILKPSDDYSGIADVKNMFRN